MAEFLPGIYFFEPFLNAAPQNALIYCVFTNPLLASFAHYKYSQYIRSDNIVIDTADLLSVDLKRYELGQTLEEQTHFFYGNTQQKDAKKNNDHIQRKT